MPTKQAVSETDKYRYLLQLSKDQIRALQANDFAALNGILAAKDALIGSLKDGQRVLAADPALAAMALSISENEQTAQTLLAEKMQAVQDQMQRVGQAKPARRAYTDQKRKLPDFIPTTETPMLFDSHS